MEHTRTVVNERDAYIALNMMEGIGPVGVGSLTAALGSAAAIMKAPKNALMAVDGIGPILAEKIVSQRDRIDVEKEMEAAEKIGARIVARPDAEYPQQLLQIHDPPLALYVRGSLESKDRHSIAIVGTRHATHYGLECATRLAYQLAQVGFVVVSGLARGIDTAAHQGALKAKGRTIAVLGSGLDCIYPSENEGLARSISEEHGAVMTEFPLGRQPDKTTFPYRNRLVSGLSTGVVVVEAGIQSGAIITATQAMEQGRTVFAVPGRIDSPSSKGAHQLIKDGATLVESVDDILKEYEILFPDAKERLEEKTSPLEPQLSEDEQTLVRVLKQGPVDVDTLIRESGLKAAQVSAILLGLEMKRVARMLPGRQVELIWKET